MTKIGFIGLGNMGAPMCINLVKAGHEVTAFDLSEAAVQAVSSAGAQVGSSTADVARSADIVVTMLPAGKHVHSVYFESDGVIHNIREGALLIDCSTISVTDARAAIEKAESSGFEMVDAPVSGGVAAAAAGTLTFMVGGADRAFEKARPVLEAMGGKIIHAGGGGNGQVAKIANNMLLGISMIATCEAFDLAERLGLDAQTFFDISSNASGQNWSMTSYCPAPGPVESAPSNKGYAPGFTVDMMLKDLRLAGAASEVVDADTQFGYLATKTYERLSMEGHGMMDFSVVMKRLQGELN